MDSKKSWSNSPAVLLGITAVLLLAHTGCAPLQNVIGEPKLEIARNGDPLLAFVARVRNIMVVADGQSEYVNLPTVQDTLMESGAFREVFMPLGHAPRVTLAEPAHSGGYDHILRIEPSKAMTGGSIAEIVGLKKFAHVIEFHVAAYYVIGGVSRKVWGQTYAVSVTGPIGTHRQAFIREINKEIAGDFVEAYKTSRYASTKKIAPAAFRPDPSKKAG